MLFSLFFLHRYTNAPFVPSATHLQRTPASGAILPQTWLQQSTGGGIQSNQSLQACQQKLRLQSLQMERERLKQRQQEIIRQVSIIEREREYCVATWGFRLRNACVIIFDISYMHLYAIAARDDDAADHRRCHGSILVGHQRATRAPGERRQRPGT